MSAGTGGVSQRRRARVWMLGRVIAAVFLASVPAAAVGAWAMFVPLFFAHAVAGVAAIGNGLAYLLDTTLPDRDRVRMALSLVAIAVWTVGAPIAGVIAWFRAGLIG
jgi:hypothetical protein